MSLRCLIVDDSRDFLEAARLLLESEGITVVGVATNGAEALRQVAELQPDVTLIDVNLGTEDGFDVACSIAASSERTPGRVILISTYAEDDLLDPASTAGELPFLSKTRLCAESLREALR